MCMLQNCNIWRNVKEIAFRLWPSISWECWMTQVKQTFVWMPTLLVIKHLDSYKWRKFVMVSQKLWMFYTHTVNCKIVICEEMKREFSANLPCLIKGMVYKSKRFWTDSIGNVLTWVVFIIVKFVTMAILLRIILITCTTRVIRNESICIFLDTATVEVKLPDAICWRI